MRMKVPDEQAIYSLIKRGARHRMVITWWHLEDFKRVEVTPGHDHARPDKNALAIEIFAQYMAQIETLEMTYFACGTRRAIRPGRSSNTLRGSESRNTSPHRHRNPQAIQRSACSLSSREWTLRDSCVSWDFQRMNRWSPRHAARRSPSGG
jgi:hypothetical protein